MLCEYLQPDSKGVSYRHIITWRLKKKTKNKDLFIFFTSKSIIYP